MKTTIKISPFHPAMAKT